MRVTSPLLRIMLPLRKSEHGAKSRATGAWQRLRQRRKDICMSYAVAGDDADIFDQTLAVPEIKRRATNVAALPAGLCHEEKAGCVVPYALAIGAPKQSEVYCRFTSGDQAVLDHAVEKQWRGGYTQ